jgi:membrane protease YdiL (CAAX protease family)
MEYQDCVKEQNGGIETRSFALVALAVFAVSEIISTLVFRYTEGKAYSCFVVLISLKTIIIIWVIPLLIIYKIERRDIRSLGLFIPKDKYVVYFLYAVVTLILPLLVVGYNSSYPIEFLEQILYIGLAEEVFYRGYLMTRMCQWLGKYSGLMITSLLFGLGHIISRVADQGIGYILPATYIGLQAFFGGLFFGFIYLRAKNIWATALLHISTNMYLSSLITLFYK